MAHCACIIEERGMFKTAGAEIATDIGRSVLLLLIVRAMYNTGLQISYPPSLTRCAMPQQLRVQACNATSIANGGRSPPCLPRQSRPRDEQ